MRHRHSVTEDPVKVAGIVAIAAAVGASVAMLFTPRNGKQVRGGLSRRAHHLKEEAAQRLNSTVEEVGDTAKEAKQSVQSTAAKVADDAKTTTSKVSDDAKATKTRAKATTKSATKPPRSSS